jgi:hypothetical protein
MSEDHPAQSPLFHAEHSERYSRQELIQDYESAFDCRLVVLIDVIAPWSITLFEELIYNADPAKDLHLLLHTPGGDGEIAVRLVRAAQSRCREFTVIIPDQAKSAGTLLCLGAHHIGMGPTSDLGPVDPQLQFPDGRLQSAKSIIAAVEAAEEAVKATPESYPIHASLLANVDALLVQNARAAMDRSAELMREALRSHPGRNDDEVQEIAAALHEVLIQTANSHAAIFGPSDAAKAGLPVLALDPTGDQWSRLWRLWAKYFVTGNRWYEGVRSSKDLGERRLVGF